MTVKEYAKLINLSPQAVTAALRSGRPYEGIVTYVRMGHQWYLTVDEKKVKK